MFGFTASILKAKPLDIDVDRKSIITPVVALEFNNCILNGEIDLKPDGNAGGLVVLVPLTENTIAPPGFKSDNEAVTLTSYNSFIPVYDIYILTLQLALDIEPVSLLLVVVTLDVLIDEADKVDITDKLDNLPNEPLKLDTLKFNALKDDVFKLLVNTELNPPDETDNKVVFNEE